MVAFVMESSNKLNPHTITVQNLLHCHGKELPNPGRAGVAQLVEHELPKLGVAGSSPVARSSVLSGSSRQW